MNQNPSGYLPSSVSTSSNGLGHTNLDSVCTENPAALEVVFEDPRSRKAPAEPSRKLPRHFTSLIEDLSQETSQADRRRQQGLDDPKKLRQKLAKLKKIDLIQNPRQQLDLNHWEKVVIIAATIVDRHLGYKAMARETLIQLNGKKLSHDTILRDEKVVREIVKLTDHLYLQWKHELALELLVLLDTPLSILRQQSVLKFNELKLLLQQCTPSVSIKSPIKLYLPFLVLLLRPKYSLANVQEALATSLFDKNDWDAFYKASHLVYDPIRDIWNTKEDYPTSIRIQILGFKTFEASPDLQQKAAQVSKNQTGCTRTNSSIFAYDWSEYIHGPVVQQAVQDLVKSGVLKAEEIYVDRVSASLSSGSTIVPTGRLQIVVPVAPSDGSLNITLSGRGFSTTVEWNTWTGYLLSESTLLSTTATVEYISLLLVL